MKSRNIDSHSLQQKRGPLSHWFRSSQGELVKKLLMAINGPWRARGAKLVCEKSGLAQSPNIIHRATPAVRLMRSACAAYLETTAGRLCFVGFFTKRPEDGRGTVLHLAPIANLPAGFPYNERLSDISTKADMMATFAIIVQFVKDHEKALAGAGIIGAILGAILTKLIPYIWELLCKLGAFLLTLLTGKRSAAEFEKKYLSSVINTHKGLRLPGIATWDTRRAPELEQVFISLTLDQPGNALSIENLWDLFAKAEISTALFREIQFKRETGASAKELLRMVGEASEFLKLRKDNATGALSDARREAVNSLALLYDVHFQSREGQAEIQSILGAEARVAILGKPGSGKTTLLQYLALTYARERVKDPKARIRGVVKKRLGTRTWRLPIFVTLSRVSKTLARSDASAPKPTLLDAILESLPPDLRQHKAAEPYLRDHLESGDCLLLLDGLDEVPTQEEFEAVTEAVQSAAAFYADNRFVITSRVAGWRTGVGTDFLVHYVNDFSSAEVDSFAGMWCLAVEINAGLAPKAASTAASAAATELKRAIHDSERIGDLATNPLLLSIIALVHRSLGTLPRDRTRLYAESVKLFLELWDVRKGIRVNDTGLNLEQKDALMRTIAFAMHAGQIGEPGGSRQASRELLIREVERLLPSFGKQDADAGELLKNLADRSGLLIERSVGVYMFSHLTFQEYFTASRLAHDQPSASVAFLTQPDRVLSDWWQEVILLYSALVPDSSPLIQSICNAAKSDDLCAQHLRLACLCTAESISLGDSGLRNSIMGRLAGLRARGHHPTFESIPGPVSDYLLRWCKGPEWYEAAAEATLTGLTGDPGGRAARLVIDALASHRWMVRKAAVSAVSAFGLELPGAARDKMLAFLDDTHPNLRVAILQLLNTLRQDQLPAEPAFAQRIVSLLADPSDEVQLAAASLKLSAASLDSVLSDYADSLLRLSSGNNYGVRIAASDALQRLARDRSEAVLVALKDKLASGETPDRQNEMVFRLAASLDSSLALPSLSKIVEDLCSPDYTTMSEARAKLRGITDPILIRAASDLLRERLSNPWRVTSTLAALQECSSPAISLGLEDRLLDLSGSWRPNTRAGAVGCLAMLPSATAAAVLPNFMRDWSLAVRAAAASVAKSISIYGRGKADPAALTVVRMALQDRSQRVVRAALLNQLLIPAAACGDFMGPLTALVQRCLADASFLRQTEPYGNGPRENLVSTIARAGKHGSFDQAEPLLIRVIGSQKFDTPSRLKAIEELCQIYADEGRADQFGEVADLLRTVLSAPSCKIYYLSSVFVKLTRLAVSVPGRISVQVNQLLDLSLPLARKETVSLLEMAVPLDIKVARRALTDVNSEVRQAALAAVGQRPDKAQVLRQLADRVVALLADGNPDTRNLAWDLFCAIGQPSEDAAAAAH
jgi:hypothetical protein